MTLVARSFNRTNARAPSPSVSATSRALNPNCIRHRITHCARRRASRHAPCPAHTLNKQMDKLKCSCNGSMTTRVRACFLRNRSTCKRSIQLHVTLPRISPPVNGLPLARDSASNQPTSDCPPCTVKAANRSTLWQTVRMQFVHHATLNSGIKRAQSGRMCTHSASCEHLTLAP